MKPFKGGKPLKKVTKPLKLDIYKINVLFPESMAQCFRWAGNGREMYFLMDTIKKMAKVGDENNPVTAMVRCLKMDDETKFLEETYVTIKAWDGIVSLQVQEFYNKAMENYNLLCLAYKIKPTDKLKKLIQKYEYYSFKRRRKAVQKKIQEKPEEILPT